MSTMIYFKCPAMSTSIAMGVIPAVHVQTHMGITTLGCTDIDPVELHYKLIDLATQIEFYAEIIQPHQLNRYLSLDNEFKMSQGNRNLEELFLDKWTINE